MYLISIEGADSSGKTTVAKLVLEYLKENHIRSVYIHEGEVRPNAETPFLSEFFSLKDPWVRDLLYTALTISTIQRGLAPLSDDTVVILDRYVDSLAVYLDEHTDYEMAEYVREFVTSIAWDAPTPLLTLFCNTPLEEIGRRRKALGAHFDPVYEAEIIQRFKSRLGRLQTRVVEIHPSTSPVDILNTVRCRLKLF